MIGFVHSGGTPTGRWLRAAYAPKKACSCRGCAALVESGVRFCAAHRKQAGDEDRARRGNSAQRGYGSRWRDYRERFLARYPLCGMRPGQARLAAGFTEWSKCKAGGFLVPATRVDHILPVAGAQDARFWDAANHQALCERCHNSKTSRERSEQGAEQGRPGGV